MPPLAPSLGRLAAPPTAGRWEPLRLALLDTLVQSHNAGALTHEAWLGAWVRTAHTLRDEVVAAANEALTTAAQRSRYPARRLAASRPDDEQADILLQRLLAEAIPLEALRDQGDGATADRGRGAALESAWEGASQIATTEWQRWRSEAARIAAWRRPWRPILALGGGLLIAALVVAAWLGGQLSAPSWFAPVATWFWGLPWP